MHFRHVLPPAPKVTSETFGGKHAGESDTAIRGFETNVGSPWRGVREDERLNVEDADILVF